jgi:hypothetical protein
MLMIVHEPGVQELGDEVVVEAAFAGESPELNNRQTLWFALPRRLAGVVDRRADAFAVGILPLAMHLGEPLEVRGDLSARLAGGMREYQRIQSAWKPDFFREVEVRAERLVARDPTATAGVVATSFSGGVDSFYTLQRHLPENEPYPSYRVGCCLMIDGFDGDAAPGNPGAFARLRRAYEPMLAGRGLDLVVVRTNLLQLLGPWVRQQSFGAFLTAPALLLGRLLARYYIPSGCKITTMGLFRDGSHLMLDHLLSSESLDVIHDSADATRVEKTVAISQWREIFDLLRVCHHATAVEGAAGGIANCCACEKCVRTMVTLELTGMLGSFTTFPRPLERERIRATDFSTAASRLFTDEIIEYAERLGRRDLIRDIRAALFSSRYLRPPIGVIVGANHRLELRSATYSRLVAVAKRRLKATGWGRGWLY